MSAKQQFMLFLFFNLSPICLFRGKIKLDQDFLWAIFLCLPNEICPLIDIHGALWSVTGKFARKLCNVILFLVQIKSETKSASM